MIMNILSIPSSIHYKVHRDVLYADETIKITNYQSTELLIHFKGKLMERVTITFCNTFWHIYRAYLCHKYTQRLISVALLSDSSLIVLQSRHLV